MDGDPPALHVLPAVSPPEPMELIERSRIVRALHVWAREIEREGGPRGSARQEMATQAADQLRRAAARVELGHHLDVPSPPPRGE